jgi:hypothetical protein
MLTRQAVALPQCDRISGPLPTATGFGERGLKAQLLALPHTQRRST